MKRKHIFKIIIITLLLLCFGIAILIFLEHLRALPKYEKHYSTIYETNGTLKIYRATIPFYGTPNINCFDDEIDLILIGRPTNSILDEQGYRDKVDQIYYYTERNIEILKVLRGNYSKNNIVIRENLLVLDLENTIEVDIYGEQYPLTEDSTYILFLSKKPRTPYYLSFAYINTDNIELINSPFFFPSDDYVFIDELAKKYKEEIFEYLKTTNL